MSSAAARNAAGRSWHRATGGSPTNGLDLELDDTLRGSPHGANTGTGPRLLDLNATTDVWPQRADSSSPARLAGNAKTPGRKKRYGTTRQPRRQGSG